VNVIAELGKQFSEYSHNKIDLFSFARSSGMSQVAQEKIVYTLAFNQLK